MNKEVIERVKERTNGFSQKDMLLYVVGRIDNIYDKLETGNGKIAANRASISAIWKVFSFAVGLLGIVVTYLGATR